MADVYDKLGGYLANQVKSPIKGALKGITKSFSSIGKSPSSSSPQQVGADNKPVKGGGLDSVLMNINQSLQSIVMSSSSLSVISKEMQVISKNVDKMPRIIKKKQAEDFFYKQKQKENFDELFKRLFRVEQSSGVETGSDKSKGLDLDKAGGGGVGIGRILATILGYNIAKNILTTIKNSILKMFGKKSQFSKTTKREMSRALFQGGKKGIGQVIKRVLAGGALVAVGKIGLIAFVIGSIIKAIYDGFADAKEGEKFSVREAFSGFLQLLTLGTISDDFAKSIYDSLASVLNKFKTFFGGLFGSEQEETPTRSGRDRNTKLGSNKNVETGQTLGPDFSREGQGGSDKPIGGFVTDEKGPQAPNQLEEIIVTPQTSSSFDNSNMMKTSTAPTQQSSGKKQALGNFLNNTGASSMLGNNIMPMMGNIKSSTGAMNPGDMAKKGFGSMFGNMGSNMGVDAGALTGDLKGGIQGIKNSEDKQAGLMNALGNLASNPAVQNFRGKPSDEASRMENVNQASSGLSNLLGGAMGSMGVDTKSLQDQYGSKPMKPGGGSTSLHSGAGVLSSKKPSGAEMSDYSQAVSDGQRMESAPKGGGIQSNSQTFNNSNQTKVPGSKKSAPVLNKDLFKQLNMSGGFSI